MPASCMISNTLTNIFGRMCQAHEARFYNKVFEKKGRTKRICDNGFPSSEDEMA